MMIPFYVMSGCSTLNHLTDRRGPREHRPLPCSPKACVLLCTCCPGSGALDGVALDMASGVWLREWHGRTEGTRTNAADCIWVLNEMRSVFTYLPRVATFWTGLW